MNIELYEQIKGKNTIETAHILAEIFVSPFGVALRHENKYCKKSVVHIIKKWNTMIET